MYKVIIEYKIDFGYQVKNYYIPAKDIVSVLNKLTKHEIEGTISSIEKLEGSFLP